MELIQNEKPSRAFDDLRRNFYRTLSELRKHQKWKRKMQVVDVASRNVDRFRRMACFELTRPQDLFRSDI